MESSLSKVPQAYQHGEDEDIGNNMTGDDDDLVCVSEEEIERP